jgi:hypothetical protein
MNNQAEDKKILQIIPSGGWKAVYALDDGQTLVLDLICWALVEERGETSVEGMVGPDYADFADEESNFLGYQSPSGEPDWADEAAKRATKQCAQE